MRGAMRISPAQYDAILAPLGIAIALQHFNFQSSTGKQSIIEQSTQQKKPTITADDNNRAMLVVSCNRNRGVCRIEHSASENRVKSQFFYNVSYPVKDNVDNFTRAACSLSVRQSNL